MGRPRGRAMLLRELKGVNVLGLREVKLPWVPASGIVALEFDNGCDRRLIPDLLSFALLGASRGSGDLIRPDAGYAYVELGLSSSETGAVTVLRGVDRKGAHQVSLREPEINEILSDRSEIDSRLLELLVGDPDRFDDIILGLRAAESAAITGAPTPVDPDPPDLSELRAARKRLRHRLRRTTKRIGVLEAQLAAEQPAQPEIEGDRGAAEIEERLLALISALGDALLAPPADEGLRGKVVAVERVVHSIESSLGEVSARIETLEKEREGASERTGRVAEYQEKLRELRNVMHAAGGRTSLPMESAAGEGAGRSLKLAWVFGIVAAWFLLVTILARFGVGLTGGLMDIAAIALGVGVLMNAGFALHFLRLSQVSADVEADEPMVERAPDPLPLIEEIEREYADVVPIYDGQSGRDLDGMADALTAEIEGLELDRKRLERARQALLNEWDAVRELDPVVALLPVDPGDAADEPARGLDELVDRCLDLIGEIRASATASAADTGGMTQAVREARDALLLALDAAVSAAGADESADAVMKGAGWGSDHLRGNAPDRDRRISELLSKLRERTMELCASPVAETEELGPGARKREKTARLLVDARGRLEETERELAEVLAVLDGPPGKPAAKTAEVEASGRGLESRLVECAELISSRSAGPGFVVIDADEVSLSVAELRALVDQIAPSVEQVLVLCPPGWAAGEDVTRLRWRVGAGGEASFRRG